MSDDAYLVSNRHSMRALLSVAIQEAVKLALVDSVIPPDGEEWTEDERREFRYDIHKLPSDAIARMSPVALAQNVAIRLLGSGGWMVGGIYAGNATAREVFEATIERPDYSAVDELAFDLGLAYDEPPDDEGSS